MYFIIFLSIRRVIIVVSSYDHVSVRIYKSKLKYVITDF
jgi:hypothetical protein